MGRKHLFYWCIAGGFICITVLALGPGLWHDVKTLKGHWIYEMFGLVCHQTPVRSYWIGGTPMAVCSRCLGIYTSLSMGTVIILPLLQKINLERKMLIIFLLAVMAINAIDLMGNMMRLWQNTLASRYVAGQFIGMGIIVGLFGNEKYNRIQNRFI